MSEQLKAVVIGDIADDELRDILDAGQVAVLHRCVAADETVPALAEAEIVDVILVAEKASSPANCAVPTVRVGHDAPLEKEALLHAIGRAVVLSEADRPEMHPSSLLGDSKAMAALRDLIAQVAPSDANVLVRGETGTGKELVAREIHGGSARRSGPIVSLHCAALPESLLESELFGYEKGAFTGAAQRKRGRIEIANGGTLFLDEIGDVPASVQVKLLRILQERRFERLGGTESHEADVRIVAATHRDLDAMAERGEFREDLFYRLNVVPIWVPPLRARRDDIAMLATHFCKAAAARNRKTVTIAPGALEALGRERWPGNVRQLQNIVERLVVLCRSDSIDADAVAAQTGSTSPFATQSYARTGTANAAIRAATGDKAGITQLDEAVERAERDAIRRALVAADGNRQIAARLLGVARATLYKKLRQLGI